MKQYKNCVVNKLMIKMEQTCQRIEVHILSKNFLLDVQSYVTC